MIQLTRQPYYLIPLAYTLLRLLGDALRFLCLCLRPHSAVWRVRHKRLFLEHSAHTRQNAVLVTTRLYVPEVHSPAVTLLPYDLFSTMEHVRSQKNPARNVPEEYHKKGVP